MHQNDVLIIFSVSTLSSMFTPSKRRVFTPPQFRYKGSTAERPLKEQQQSHHEIASYSSDTSRLTRNADVDKPNIYTHDKSPIPSSSIFSNFSDIIPSKVKENGNMPNGSSSKFDAAKGQQFFFKNSDYMHYLKIQRFVSQNDIVQQMGLFCQ